MTLKIPSSSSCTMCEQEKSTYRLTLYDASMNKIVKICSEKCLKTYNFIDESAKVLVSMRVKKVQDKVTVLDMETD